MNKKGVEWTINIVILLIIILLFLDAIMEVPISVSNFINELIISVLTSAIFSAIVGTIVEFFTGNRLKKIFINIRITRKIRFSISAFIITTFIMKVMIFGF